MDQDYPTVDDKYVLYGSEFSSSTAKICSYFQKKGIPFVERVVNTVVLKKFIKPRTGLKFIPVVQTPEDFVLQDTTDIIEKFEKKYPDNPFFPTVPIQKLAVLLLEVYTDEWLTIPAMHYRWNFPKYNNEYIFKELSRTTDPKYPKFLHNTFNLKVIEKKKKALKSLGISKTTIPAIETSYIQLLGHLNHHFENHKFILGNTISVADFSFVGPFYSNFYRDPYAGNIMKKTAPHVLSWLSRMVSKESINSNFFVNKDVPSDLDPIFKKMAREQIPVLMDSANIVNQWYAKNKYNDLPRKLGRHNFRINDAQEKRDVMPYSLWKWQHPYYYYHSINTLEQLKLDPWLRRINLYEALNTSIETPLRKIDNFILAG